MKIVRPYAIQDGDLTSNATNADAAWSDVTAYVVGNRASYGRRIYQSIQNGTNKNPATETTYWLDVGPNNVWAMFDDRTGTQTVRATPLEVTLDVAGYADTMGLLNVVGSQLQVIMMSGIDEIFNETIMLVDEGAVVDYYEYFFEPIIPLTDVTINLPVDIYNPTITIILTGTGDVAIGNVTIGQSYFIGRTFRGAQLSGTDYSKIEEDDFGNTFIVERAYNRTGRFTVAIEENRTDAVYNIVTGYRATPVFVIGIENYGSSFYYGLLRDAAIEFAYPGYTIMTLEVRGI